jgi:hypothetical protein
LGKKLLAKKRGIENFLNFQILKGKRQLLAKEE